MGCWKCCHVMKHNREVRDESIVLYNERLVETRKANDATQVCVCCCCCAGGRGPTLTAKQHGPPLPCINKQLTCQLYISHSFRGLSRTLTMVTSDGRTPVYEWCRLYFSPSRRVWQWQEEKMEPFAVAADCCTHDALIQSVNCAKR